MDEELIKFINREITIDMNGTTENDWRQLLADCKQLGFDLDKAAQDWFGNVLPKEDPFISYEQQNIKGPHKNGGWELMFQHLERDGSGIHSVRNPSLQKKKSISYLELKKEFERAPEFTLDF